MLRITDTGAAAASKQRSTILKWLSSLEMTSIHRTNVELVASGSAKWFLTHRTFADWKNGKGKHIWCQGIRELWPPPIHGCVLIAVSWRRQNCDCVSVSAWCTILSVLRTGLVRLSLPIYSDISNPVSLATLVLRFCTFVTTVSNKVSKPSWEAYSSN